MKSIFIILLFGMFVSSYAESSIDVQIQKIRSAPPKERVQMMNALKVQLSNMNAQQRNEAISHLRTGTRVNSHESHTNDTHQEMRKDSYQSDSMQDIHDVERMNQKQGEDQFMHEQENMDGTTNNYMDSVNNSETQTPMINNQEPIPYIEPENNVNNDMEQQQVYNEPEVNRQEY